MSLRVCFRSYDVLISKHSKSTCPRQPFEREKSHLLQKTANTPLCVPSVGCLGVAATFEESPQTV